MTAWAPTKAALRKELGRVESDLRLVRDPWVRRDLARKRRELRDKLARL